MSLKALLEILVHLENFRNIDLFYQGLYFVKINLKSKNPQEVNSQSSKPSLLSSSF